MKEVVGVQREAKEAGLRHMEGEEGGWNQGADAGLKQGRDFRSPPRKGINWVRGQKGQGWEFEEPHTQRIK